MATATYTIPTTPFFLQKKPGDGTPITYSAADFRRYTAALLRRTGVLGANDFIVAQATNVGFKIKVNSGFAHVGGTGLDYLVHLPSDVEIDVTNFNLNPSGLRTHKVWVTVNDALYGGSTEYTGNVVVTEDIGSGAPTPTAAANIYIASFTITGGQANILNSHIRNSVRRYGGSAGEYTLLNLASGYKDAFDQVGCAPVRAIYTGGGFVRLGGAVWRDGGTPFTGGNDYKVMTLPGNYRPNNYTRYQAATCSIYYQHSTSTGTGSYSCRLRIDPDGSVTVTVPSINNPQFVHLDGVTYDLDD